jgi:hypothetical protein
MALMIKLLVAALALCTGAEASAQHHDHRSGGSSRPGASAYAGEEARDIKALSAQEQRAWLEGEGMGLARAAELNRYPGPMHVLEHADELGLSGLQRETTHELMHRHKREVRALGAELVAAERRLDDLFRSRRATPAEVSILTQEIGRLHARIRASHLNTHLEQSLILRPEQTAAYDRVRGYAR